MSSNIFSTFSLLAFLLSLTSCGSYKQSIMFKLPDGQNVQSEIRRVEENYVIARNDLLGIDVYTNDGERIIDPDRELVKNIPSNTTSIQKDHQYLVTMDGTVKLPMVGLMKLEGLTIRQAEEILQKEYSKFYSKPLVILSYKNKRVVVLGSPEGVVIPLTDDNVTLAEVLALSKAINTNAKAGNIRVLRGDEVFVADFRTFDGYRKSNMVMQPGDIVYVEPIRRPFVEAMRDYAPAISVVTGLTTLIAVLISL